ncbi:MAG: acyl phosphate:glycerol-3-phosphate acyltransferase [Pseudomonadota bacterium]|nr:acyl phosphate:glycerol-3-phosphate acyltransferase [Pseudomonadota bacterium]
MDTQLIITISIFALTGYLLGSISTAIITCKLMGLPDPRTDGSKNPGATNVLRLGGKKAAAITLAGDMLKGLIPALAATSMDMPHDVVAAAGLSAFLGHLFPVFYGFRGGKGVATLLGVLLGINWMAGTATIGVWLFMAYVFKISSLSALTAALLAPAIIYFISGSTFMAVIVAVMTLLLFWRHRRNIANLLSGQEGRIKSGS